MTAAQNGGGKMQAAAGIARYVGILCLAGIALLAYVFGASGGAMSFWAMAALLAGFCVSVAVVVTDSILDIGRPNRK